MILPPRGMYRTSALSAMNERSVFVQLTLDILIKHQGQPAKYYAFSLSTCTLSDYN